MRLEEGRIEARVICARLKGSTEGGNEGMTNDQKVERHEATRVMGIEVR